MFFHTEREQAAGAIAGVTDVFGVTLLNRTHPFPLLVEEEEKTHGALLANTTHGALMRALGSIDGIHNGQLVQFRAFPDEGPEPGKVYNRIRFAYDRVLARSIDFHEAFSKYLGFCVQYAASGNGADLDLMWQAEVGRYPHLADIAEAIGHPSAKLPHASLLAYDAAKSVLNTGDLDHLLAQTSAASLYEALGRPDLMANLHARFRTVLRAVASADSTMVRSNPAGTREAMTTALRKAGHFGEEPLDSGTLSARGVLLGKRLAGVAPGVLHCHLEDGHIGWTVGRVLEIDQRYLWPDGRFMASTTTQSIGGILDSDPSLTVSYDVFTRGGTWPHGDLADIDLESAEETILYLAAGDDGPIDCYCIVRGQGADATMFLHRDLSWPQLQPLLERCRRERLVLAMLPASFGKYTINVAPSQILAEAVQHIARVVYWRPAFSPDDILRSEAYVYRPSSADRTAVERRGPAGVIGVRRGSVSLSCAPLYAVAMVSTAVAQNQGPGMGKPPNFIDGRVLSISDVVFDKRPKRVADDVVAGARVYELLFERGILPGDLPLYDPMALFDAIIEGGEHGGKLRS